jgi:hypothetical protein
LPWKTVLVARCAGVAAGAALLLAPVSLARNDLKQYTADAFFALALVALASRAEQHNDRRSLAALAVLAVVALPFSSTSAFVSAALFSGLLARALMQRSRPRVTGVLIAGGAAGAGIAVYFLAVVIPQQIPALRDYWNAWYLTGGLSDAFSLAVRRFGQVADGFGLPELVLLALLAAGLVVLVRLDRPALAAGLVLLWLEMVVAGALRRYPYLDLRTSHFMLALWLTVAAIGAAGAVSALAQRTRAVAAVVAAALVALFLNNAVPHLREHTIARHEDVRSEVDFVAEHRMADDIVVVSRFANFGFGYYWPDADVTYIRDESGSTGFRTEVENVPNVVWLTGRGPGPITTEMRRVVDDVRARRAAGRPARLWLVRTHRTRAERKVWDKVLRTLGLGVRPISPGVEPVEEVTGL